MLSEPDTESDKLGSRGHSRKLEGQGSCIGYNQEELDELLAKHQLVLSEEPGLTAFSEFIIDTGDTDPISQYPHRTPDRLLDKIREEIESLRQKAITEPSNSLWSSPIIPVLKPNGKIRVCVDYRKLNAHTKPVSFYMPTVEEIVDQVGQWNVISKLDLSKGFHQVTDKEKTTFVSHCGKFQYCRMPFGLRNVRAVFQQTMEKALEGCREFSRPYIDDIVVYSKCWSDHLVHVDRVLETRGRAGLTANPLKCEWGGRKLVYLGHLVGSGTKAVPRDRAAAMANYVRPRTRRDLKSFLGSLSYYRNFIPRVADFTSVLTPASTTQAPATVRWDEGMVSAFNHLCNSLCNVCELTVPTSQDTFILQTDASQLGLGGVLSVIRNGEELPVAFFARQLRGAEKNYSATELEALGVVCGVEHFDHYLYDRAFVIYTDHKALCSLLTSKCLNRLQRMALKLQQWTCEIVYHPGKLNGNADGLSRQEWPMKGEDDLQAEDPNRCLDSTERDSPTEGGCPDFTRSAVVSSKFQDMTRPRRVAGGSISARGYVGPCLPH